MSDIQTPEVKLKTTDYQDVQPCTPYENMDLTKWDKIFAHVRRDANTKCWGTYDEPTVGQLVMRTKLKSWKNRADIACNWRPKIKFKSRRMTWDMHHCRPVDSVK